MPNYARALQVPAVLLYRTIPLKGVWQHPAEVNTGNAHASCMLPAKQAAFKSQLGLVSGCSLAPALSDTSYTDQGAEKSM
jgi:hypothetical protein